MNNFDYNFTKYVYEEANILIKCWVTDDDNNSTDFVGLSEEEDRLFWRKYKLENPEMLREDRNKKLMNIFQ